MGVVSRDVAYGFLVASYRRRMGVVAVREMARHRYRCAQYVGLTSRIAQLDVKGGAKGISSNVGLGQIPSKMAEQCHKALKGPGGPRSAGTARSWDARQPPLDRPQAP